MIQVWLLDENNFYKCESIFVKEVKENMTTVPLLVGYVKPKFTGNEWVEGATTEEIQEYKANKIDNCSPVPALADLVLDANKTRTRLDAVENAILELLLKG